MTEPTTPAVRLVDLTFAYPDGTGALHGVNLDIATGERVAVLGPNGAGKSTLMLHMNGVLTAASGEVHIGGTRLDRNTVRSIRQRVGVVFQDPNDQLFMPTVEQDVAFGPANFGVRGERLAADVRDALAAVGMTDRADRSPTHLSVGERRRAALATVLACRPEVLVLDEPAANLDPVARRELADILLTLPTTILMVTHDLPYAQRVCERAVILDAGRVVANGPIDEILEDSALLANHRLS
ncbi:energy-coupling factor ABC transporter ATP-binding protein [Nocardia amikacinitolerans]|uniref:energy-coupling factor ABC transporter ATP-binding protein n=1 Tax=Nocardia amikacinitolerans TaxID=756689 RepID=UPI0020A49B5C|nr:ABC transporter ATP-binding protein [Nocardia amikacinitolerans]MCP2280450.1 cobalt/nickel transport system ATP-binding protein [Nocardia amikacinitolerans]MCP2297614.1 cobalt/nickel transport system ATP-binding protein [Nocardia amikacinitolerans]